MPAGDPEALLDRVISAALGGGGARLPCEISVLLTDDAGIQQINREMREVDRPTDVLSFPCSTWSPDSIRREGEEDPETGLVPLGDMCVSPGTGGGPGGGVRPQRGAGAELPHRPLGAPSAGL